jgi:hypothetical protein
MFIHQFVVRLVHNIQKQLPALFAVPMIEHRIALGAYVDLAHVPELVRAVVTRSIDTHRRHPPAYFGPAWLLVGAALTLDGTVGHQQFHGFAFRPTV